MDTHIDELISEMKRNNYKQHEINQVLDYYRRLSERGKPVLFDAEHVRKVLKMDGIKRNAYHLYKVGSRYKTREIESPSLNLKNRQRWIVNHILEDEEIGSWIHGYVKGKSIVTNARVHLNKKRLLRIDIKHFFGSITFDMVKNLFVEIGYSKSAADELARICTFSTDMYCWNQEYEERNEYKYIPHGAPSSPYIANLVFQKVDKQIIDLLQCKQIDYSRYADDLFFSSDVDELSWIVQSVSALVQKYGFEINMGKTKLFKDNDIKLIMGLNLSNGLRVQNSYKRKLRQEIYYCKKFGIMNHLEHGGKEKKANYQGYLYGKAYFINMVEPSEGKRFLKELDDLFAEDTYLYF